MNDQEQNFSFGYLVRRYRQALDLTQSDLARQVGCALVTISKIERDERRPSRQMAGILAEQLNVPLSSHDKFIAAGLGELPVNALPIPGRPESAGKIEDVQRRRHNLPAPVTQLIGRDRDLQNICSILLSPNVRVLTLVGPGGAGKTRLSLAVCSELLDHFADGVFFVPLGPVAAPGLVDTAIADVLGVREIGRSTMYHSLVHYLQTKKILLLLDNFEHLMPATSLVRDLLAAAPELKILTTSRANLRIYGEHAYQITPLSLPGSDALSTGEITLEDYSACQLFLERAYAIKNDLTLTEEDTRAVAKICIQLDGLPLAIELAAARVRLLPPRNLVEQLSSRLQFLTRGATDAPVRHQTLRDTINWSHDLLDVEEQQLFARLAIFPAGCTLEAAEIVANMDSDIDLMSALESLVDKSLLMQKDDGSGPRFSMLETFREYGLERLLEYESYEAVHRTFVHYYLRQAEESSTVMLRSTPVATLAMLNAEYDNLRAALRWAYEHHEIRLYLHLAGALWRYWEIRGLFTEGRLHLETALAAAHNEEPKLLAEAHTGAGTMAFHQYDLDAAIIHHMSALALYRELSDRYGEALALNNLGVQYQKLGGHEEPDLYFEQSLAVATEIGDKVIMAMVLHNRGDNARRLKQYERATALLFESLELCRENGHLWGEAHNLIWLAHTNRRLHKHYDASKLLREGLNLSLRINSFELIAECLEEGAGLAADRMQPERAAILWGAAEAVRNRFGMPLPDDERNDRHEGLALARAAAGVAVFDSAWAKGQNLLLEVALEML